MNVRPVILASTVLALVIPAGCSEPGAPNEQEQEPINFPLPINPRNVLVTLQPARAASARVTTAGGTVTATANDGTVYTLTLPPNALLFDTTVTITPITTVTGLDMPGGGRFVGVQLEPNGLQLFEPAKLRMQPPEGERVSVIGFTAHNGQDVHRSPFSVDPTRLEMLLMHFSSGFGHINGPGTGPAFDPMPANPAAQLQAALEKLARPERQKALVDEPGDPQYSQKVERVFDAFWKQVLEDIVTRMQTDCDVFHAFGHVPNTWSKLVASFGMEDVFASQMAIAYAALVPSLENCWTEIIEPCLAPEDVPNARFVAQQLIVLGRPGYNPNDPALRCGDWQGTATATGPTPHGPPETVTADVEFEVDEANSDPEGGYLQWRIKTGTLRWQLGAGNSINGCPITAPEQTFPMQASDGYLTTQTIGDSKRYFGGGVVIGAMANGTESCPGQQPRTLIFFVGNWLLTGEFRTLGFGPMEGTFSLENRSYRWTFTRQREGMGAQK